MNTKKCFDKIFRNCVTVSLLCLENHYGQMKKWDASSGTVRHCSVWSVEHQVTPALHSYIRVTFFSMFGTYVLVLISWIVQLIISQNFSVINSNVWHLALLCWCSQTCIRMSPVTVWCYTCVGQCVWMYKSFVLSTRSMTLDVNLKLLSGMA